MSKSTKREILDLILKNRSTESVVDYIVQKLNIPISHVGRKSLTKLKNAISCLYARRNAKFQAASRIKDRFELQNAQWLDSDFEIPHLNTDINKEGSSSSSSPGRSPLEFKNKSLRSKRREVDAINDQHNHDVQKLMMASSYAANKSKDKDLKKVIDELTNDSEATAKMRKLDSTSVPVLKRKTPLEALVFLLDHNLTKSAYTHLRLESKACGADIWPSYNDVRKTKLQLRPPKELIHVDNSVAQVPLQALLKHTAERIVQMQEEVIFRAMDAIQCIESKLTFICSWGFDGSTGHSAYKQRHVSNNEDESESDDKSLFATTLIPLCLNSEHGVLLWNNRSSQSPRFCRPIQLRYVKESKDVILQQKQAVENEIDKLQPFVIVSGSYRITIHFSLHLTLIDGKVLNVITNTRSMQSCLICHATPKTFNNLSNRNFGMFTSNSEFLRYGISSLHAWIRFLDCCLHISYRLTIRKW